MNCTNQNMDDVIKDMSSPDTFSQWAADNFDHNLRTLDGTGTFHGISIIAISKSTTKIPPYVGPHPLTLKVTMLPVNDLDPATILVYIQFCCILLNSQKC